MSLSFSQLLANTEAAAKHAGVDLGQAILFIAHLVSTSAPQATAVADIVETATGNATLVPLTNTISSTVQAVSTAIITPTTSNS